MGLWTLTHFFNIIPAFIIYIAIAVLVGKKTSSLNEEKKFIPLKAITVVLLILEVLKQITSFVGGYDMYALPFHYCSLFLYILPFHAFYRGKHRRFVDAIALGCCASLFLFMLVMPAVVYSEGNIADYFESFSDMHTVTFHHLVCVYFLLMLSMKLYRFDKKADLKYIAVFLSVYVIIATVLSFSLEVNFHNLYKCNLGFIEDIRLALVEAIGWAGHAIYVAVLFCLTILFAYAAYFLTKLVTSKIEKHISK